MAIDRRGGLTVAKETVELAKELFLSTEDTVLGLDLSGDPTVSYYILSLSAESVSGVRLSLEHHTLGASMLEPTRPYGKCAADRFIH